MAGERDLDVLLSKMAPSLLEDEYVFVTFPEGEYGDGAHLNPVGMFQEPEGMTLILKRQVAEANNLKQESVFRCITLQVHSSLEAVGLTAAVSTKLADKDISANVVAAFYHDHVFVPADKADQALNALQS